MSPSLKDIIIVFKLGEVDVQALSDIIRQLKNLRTFVLTIEAADMPSGDGGNLSYEILQQVSTLPQLRQFRVNDYPGARIAVTPALDAETNPRRLEFAYVESLKLRVGRLECVNGVLRDTFFPNVKDLILDYSSTDVEKFRDFPPLVQSSFSPETLQTLCLGPSGTPYDAEMVSSRAVVPASLYAPLHDFHNLCEVRFETRLNLSISDVELESFGRAWPHLSSLVIMNNVEELDLEEDTPMEKPTYRGIASLVGLCPDLKTIHVAIREDFSDDMEEFLDSEDIPVSSHDVELNFLYSPVIFLDTMALWVTKIFPRTVQVYHLVQYSEIVLSGVFDGTTGPYHISHLNSSRWDELQSLIDFYALSPPPTPTA
ncbi:hypothetical protein EIP86_001935 [Pleurotus ostreatoroseus]|nr:hypothetical protein EIP86_001935 [Pleurotus ostreatoroseus]